MGVAVEIFHLSIIQPEISYTISLNKQKNKYFRFCNRHIEFSVGATIAVSGGFCSPAIFRKSHKKFWLNSLWFPSYDEKSGLGGNFTPPLTMERWRKTLAMGRLTISSATLVRNTLNNTFAVTAA